MKIGQKTSVPFFFTIIVIFCFLINYWNPPYISFGNQADGFAYYLPLRSLLYDKDLDFTNENIAYENTYGRIPYDWRHYDNSELPVYPFSIGPAILWTPFVFIFGSQDYYEANRKSDVMEGTTNKELNAIRIATLFYSIATMIFCFLFLMKIIKSSPLISFICIIIASLSTPYFYYTRYQPLMSHSLSTFVVSAFLYIWIIQLGKFTIARSIYLGIMTGIVMLVRWQDIIICLPVILEFCYYIIKDRGKINRKQLLFLSTFAIIAGITMIPQFLLWRLIYGKFFLIPQGKDFFFLNAPNLFNLLTSFKHGLFTWSPVVLFAVIGLFASTQQQKVTANINNRLISVLLLITTTAIYINSSISDWHGSDSFGARRMTSLLIIFATGLPFFFRIEKILLKSMCVSLIVLLTFYNMAFSDLFYRGEFSHVVPIYPNEVINKIIKIYI